MVSFTDDEMKMYNSLIDGIKKTKISINYYNKNEIDIHTLLSKKLENITMIYTYFDNYISQVRHICGSMSSAYFNIIIFFKKYLLMNGDYNEIYMTSSNSNKNRKTYMILRKKVLDKYINDPVNMANHKKLMIDASNKFEFNIVEKIKKNNHELQKESKKLAKIAKIKNWKASQVPKMSRTVHTKIQFKRKIKKG